MRHALAQLTNQQFLLRHAESHQHDTTFRNDGRQLFRSLRGIVDHRGGARHHCDAGTKQTRFEVLSHRFLCADDQHLPASDGTRFDQRARQCDTGRTRRYLRSSHPRCHLHAYAVAGAHIAASHCRCVVRVAQHVLIDFRIYSHDVRRDARLHAQARQPHHIGHTHRVHTQA